MLIAMAIVVTCCSKSEFTAPAKKNTMRKETISRDSENYSMKPEIETNGVDSSEIVENGAGLEKEEFISGELPEKLGGSQESILENSENLIDQNDVEIEVSEGKTDVCLDSDSSISSGRKKTKMQYLSFDRNYGQGCPLGLEGNVRRLENGYHKHSVTARRIQEQILEIPKGTQLCSIEISGENTAFVYDDLLLFTFEDFIFASPVYSNALGQNLGMQVEGSLIIFDWLKLRGVYKPAFRSLQCPDNGTCTFPPSEESGLIQIFAPRGWLELLPKNKLKKSQYSLKLIVTGNQNASTDCTHSGLQLRADIVYVEID
jgi:hypothetical protein